MVCLRLILAFLATTLPVCVFAQKPVTPEGTTKQTVVLKPHRIGSTGPSEVMDTSRFAPQIVEKFVERPERVEHDDELPWRRERVPLNMLRVGGLLKQERTPKIEQRWPAINATGWVPPDPTLAVGPSHVVATVNSSIAWFDKTGAKQFEQKMFDFFSGMGAGTFLFDPKVFYDRLAGRYFVIVLEKANSPQTSKILLAVSDDNNPNGSWHRYRIESKFTSGATTYWLDYPGFGYNADAIVISGNLFTFSNAFGGVMYQILPKAPLLSGAAASVSYIRDTNAAGFQMAEIGEAGVPVLHGISDYNSGIAKWSTISNPATAPTVTTDWITVPNFTYPNTRAPSKGNKMLDPSDGRHLNASWRNGRLLTAQTVATPSTNVNRVRWYEFDFSNSPLTAPTLIQSGEIASPVSGQHYFMGAVNKNAFGDISAIYSRSSSSIVADLMFSGRFSTDAAGAMGTPVMLVTSEGQTYEGGIRWGDYFQVDVDPADNETFWGIGMVGDPFGNWRTHVLSWRLTVPVSSVAVQPSTIIGGNAATGTVTLPMAARTNGAPVTLSSSDSVVTVPASVTVANGQTQATFNVTSTAVTSTKTVTITATSGASTATTTVTVNPGTVFGGTLSLEGLTSSTAGLPVAVELRTPGTTTVVQTLNLTLAAGGTFGSTVQNAGTYDIAVRSSRFLRKVIKNFAIPAGGTSSFAATLTNGDCDGDNRVTTTDFTIVNRAFGSSTGGANWDARADLNGDGTVNAADIAIVQANQRRRGDN